MLKRVVGFFTVIALLVVLSSCGRDGALYLPESSELVGN